MSLTAENILKSADVILGKEEKKEAEKSLKELEEKLKYTPRSIGLLPSNFLDLDIFEILYD